jgi:hypothetical protein
MNLFRSSMKLSQNINSKYSVYIQNYFSNPYYCDTELIFLIYAVGSVDYSAVAAVVECSMFAHIFASSSEVILFYFA